MSLSHEGSGLFSCHFFFLVNFAVQVDALLSITRHSNNDVFFRSKKEDFFLKYSEQKEDEKNGNSQQNVQQSCRKGNVLQSVFRSRSSLARRSILTADVS